MSEQAIPMRAILDHCGGLPLVRFEPGEVLIPEGPASDRLFIMVSGTAEVVRGDIRVAEISEPGAIFGEISALLGGPHTATVRALAPIEAYRLDHASTALPNLTEVSYHVARILARRLVDATTYLVDFKRQYAGRQDHFGLVDEVLESLVQRQRPAVAAGSSLKSDSRL